MGIGTFGAFTQARLAIYAAQTGITVTGNNISNINTPGYTRQRLNQVSLYAAGSDRYYAEGDIRTGQGALVKSISQIRSPYLDIRYRDLNAKVGFYDGRMEGLDSIARILDEVGTGDEGKGEGGYGILGLDIQKLYTALGNITDQTGHQEYDDTVKGVAASLVNRLRSYANRLEEVKNEYDIMLKENVDAANGILNEIRTLNEQIRKSEIHGDPALELRDERNRQIDSLSELIDIDVTYTEEEIAAGMKVEKLVIRLGDANPDKTQDPDPKTDRSLLIDGVYGANIILGKPVENPFYGTKIPDPAQDPDGFKALADAVQKEFDLAAAPATEDDLKTYTESPYLNQETDKDGNVTKKIPVTDIRDATILTDDADNPNYDLMITELKNKNGDLNYESIYYAAETIGGDEKVKNKDGIDTEVSALFGHRDKVAVTENDIPVKGDKTIMVYARTPQLDANGRPVKDNNGNTLYNYTVQKHEQIISKPVALDDNDLDGKIQAQREFMTEEGVFVDQKTVDSIDENAAGKRGIKYYQKALDLLANQLATAMNEANQGFLMDKNGDYIMESKNDKGETIGVPIEIEVDGQKYHINKDWSAMPGIVRTALLEKGIDFDGNELDMANAGLSGKDVIDAYLKGQKWTPDNPPDLTPGKLIPENKENILNEDGSVKIKGWGESPHGAIFVGGPLFSNGNNTNDTKDITASNISISAMWEHSAMLVRGFECMDGTTEVASGQSDNLRHLEYVASYQKHDFIPNQLVSSPNASGKPLFTGSFFDMWNDIGGTLGQDQTEASTNLETYYQNALSVDTDRDSVSSVDFNDEAMNLMMYSKSYNAACRLMTTIDSVLDKLINNTGMTT